MFVGCLLHVPATCWCISGVSEVKVTDPAFYLTQSQYTDSGPTSPSTDPITPGAWQGRHWSANIEVTGMTRPGKKMEKAGIKPQACCYQDGCMP